MLCDMGFETCQADPDVWLKPNVRPTNGFEYYEYDPKALMDALS